MKYSISITLYLLGNVSILAKELYRQKRYGTVKSLIKGNGTVATPGDETLMGLHVDEDRSLVSVITMIFPSPDWFVGVSNVDMCDPMTGEWREEYSRDLFPYDSGTDDGTSFDSPDAPTMPKKNIFLIGNEDDTNFKSDSSIRRLGTFKFTKVPTKKCKGKAYYTLTFNAEWSNETHPSPVFPTNAMFSPLIGATHNLYYEMWRRGKMASSGVQLVAETGRYLSCFLSSNKIVLTKLIFQYYDTLFFTAFKLPQSLQSLVKKIFPKIMFHFFLCSLKSNFLFYEK